MASAIASAKTLLGAVWDDSPAPVPGNLVRRAWSGRGERGRLGPFFGLAAHALVVAGPTVTIVAALILASGENNVFTALWAGLGFAFSFEIADHRECPEAAAAEGPLAETGAGYGVDGMRERAELLGGRLEAGP